MTGPPVRRRAPKRAPRLRFSAGQIEALGRAKNIGLRIGGSSHRAISLWGVVMGGRAFVRSWGLDPDGWFHRSRSQPWGMLKVESRRLRVRTVRARSEALKSAVDQAYREKYNTPGSIRFVRDLTRRKSKDTTTELVPLAQTVPHRRAGAPISQGTRREACSPQDQPMTNSSQTRNDSGPACFLEIPGRFDRSSSVCLPGNVLRWWTTCAG